MLALLLAWDAGGLDLAGARLFATPFGFPWRGSRALMLWMHEVPRSASWAVFVALFLSIRWPFGALRRLDRPQRVQLALSVLASVLAVSLFKTQSKTSCPWDLQAFGGIARYVSHWQLGQLDGGPGGCFPAGHASAAFAYVGGWFVLRRTAPGVARCWLALAVLAGFALGIGQQMRGAHYMSHTLWTAWICWSVGLAIDSSVHFFRAVRVPSPRSTNLNGS